MTTNNSVVLINSSLAIQVLKDVMGELTMVSIRDAKSNGMNGFDAVLYIASTSQASNATAAIYLQMYEAALAIENGEKRNATTRRFFGKMTKLKREVRRIAAINRVPDGGIRPSSNTFYMQKLIVTAKKDKKTGAIKTTVLPSIMARSENPQLSHIELGNKRFAVNGKYDKELKHVVFDEEMRHGTYDVISVDISKALKSVGTAIGYMFINSQIIMAVGPKMIRFFRTAYNPAKGSTSYVSLISGKAFDEFPKVKGERIYRFGGEGHLASANMIGEGKFLLRENSDKEKLFNIMDAERNGAMKKIMNRVVEKTKLVKSATRMGMETMPVIFDDLHVHSIAIIGKTFVQDKLPDNPNAVDGQGYCLDTLIAEGLVSQSRATKMIKGTLVSVTADNINSRIQDQDKNPVRFVHGEMTAIDEKNVDNMIEGNHGIYKDRVVIISDKGYDDVPEIFVDKNGLKAIFEYNNEVNFDSLNIFDDMLNDGDKIELSSQAILKFIAADFDRTKKWVMTRHAEMLNDIYHLDNLCEPSLEALVNSDLIGYNTLYLEPMMFEKYGVFAKAYIEKGIRSDMKVFNEFKLLAYGQRALVQFDYATMVAGIYLLKANEAYTNNVKLKDKIGIVIKYPSGPIYEALRIRFVGLDELKYRLRHEHKVSKEQFDHVVRMFRHACKDVIIFSAMPEVKLVLAGCDADGDEVTVITESELVKIISRQTMLGVDIDTSAAEESAIKKNHANDVVKIGRNLMAVATMAILNNNNEGVGTTTNLCSVWELPFVDGDMETTRLLLQYGCGNPGRKNGAHYKPVFTDDRFYESNGVTCVRATQDDMDSIFEQFSTMNVCDASIEKMLADVNVCMERFYQELTVDAIKHFYSVMMKFAKTMIRKGYLASTKANFSIKMRFNVETETDVAEVKNNRPFFIFKDDNDDIVATARTGKKIDELAECMVNQSVDFLRDKIQIARNHWIDLPQDDLAQIEAYWVGLSEADQKGFSSISKHIMCVASTYRKIKETNAEYNDFGDIVKYDEDQVALAREFYKFYAEAIGNEFRNYCDAIGILEDGISRVFMYFAMYFFANGIRSNSVLYMLKNCIPAEFLKYAASRSGLDASKDLIARNYQYMGAKTDDSKLVFRVNINVTKFPKYANEMSILNGFLSSSMDVISLVNIEGKNGLFVRVGDKGISPLFVEGGNSSLAKIMKDRNGIVEFVTCFDSSDTGKDGKRKDVYRSLLVGLKYVTKTGGSDAGSAAGASQEAKA